MFHLAYWPVSADFFYCCSLLPPSLSEVLRAIPHEVSGWADFTKGSYYLLVLGHVSARSWDWGAIDSSLRYIEFSSKFGHSLQVQALQFSGAACNRQFPKKALKALWVLRCLQANIDLVAVQTFILQQPHDSKVWWGSWDSFRKEIMKDLCQIADKHILLKLNVIP